jgi:hypothetical protein
MLAGLAAAPFVPAPIRKRFAPKEPWISEWYPNSYEEFTNFTDIEVSPAINIDLKKIVIGAWADYWPPPDD